MRRRSGRLTVRRALGAAMLALAAITVCSPIMQGERPCRSSRHVARGGSEEVTGTGRRCREPDGRWPAAGMPDIVAARALAPIALAPPSAMAGPPPPDPLLAQLQANLMRLAYDGGPADGLIRPGFEDAVRSFEADEGVPSSLNFIRRDLALSAAAVIRTQTTGSCRPLAAVQAASLVCGRRR